MFRYRKFLGPACAAAIASGLTSLPALSAETGLPIDALANTVWVEEFDVSPDASMVAYKSAKAGTYDIWIAPVDGGEPVQITSMPGREIKPVYSPDGKWIAFEADYRGVDVSDIYIIPAGGGDAIQLTNHPLHDSNPMWSSDSKTDLFRHRHVLVEVDCQRRYRKRRN